MRALAALGTLAWLTLVTLVAVFTPWRAIGHERGLLTLACAAGGSAFGALQLFELLVCIPVNAAYAISSELRKASRQPGR